MVCEKKQSITGSYLRPRLFYLSYYVFLPKNEKKKKEGKKEKKKKEGKKQEKKNSRDPKVQIITVGNYCNLKMVISRAQLLFVWCPCTTVHRFDRRSKHLVSARLRFQ
jgi:hypothetical protein